GAARARPWRGGGVEVVPQPRCAREDRAARGAERLRRARERLDGVQHRDARVDERPLRPWWVRMTVRDPRDVIIRPVVSEKSYAGYESNVYTFVVPADANKIEIRRAVETIFNVRVVNVNTLRRAGKRKRNRRSGAYATKPSHKRALVSLAEGDTIEIL